MRRLQARRGITACAISVAAVAACAAPGVASAKTVPASCNGSNIKAAGSTLQKLAQVSVWDPTFDTSKNAKACGGTEKPTVTYESIGSGAGLEKWGYNGHAFEAGNVAIVATDEPVDSVEKAEMESNETVKGSAPNSVQSIPVLQAAVAIIVHLPANCTATSTAAPGRLVLNNVTLEAIWNGTINNWTEIKDGGDAVSGAGCNAETPITRLVRLDGSGTTHILKKYLGLINSNPLKTTAGEKTWTALSETSLNTVWPEAANVKPAAKEGGGALVSEVAAVSSSIGYASLADSRSNGGFSKTGGPGTSKFWVEIQDSGLSTTKKPKYADPSTDGDTEAVANSNCAKTKYTNGKGTKFPPATTAATWNEVTTETKEKNYSLCGITYDTTLSKYSAYPGTSAGEAITAKQFLAYVLETKGEESGQELILNRDYEPLPKNLIKEAQTGAALTAF